MAITKTKSFITGMAGVYYTAAELSRRGFIVTLTVRNAPGVDILASTLDLKKTFSIQVKARGSNTKDWLLNKDVKKLVSPNFFYGFVNIMENKGPEFYIAKSNTVANNMRTGRWKNSTFYWFEKDLKYKDRWDILK